MELWIYDLALNLKGIVQDTNELLWTRDFFDPGTFTLTVPCTEDNVKLLTRHSLIEKPGNAEIGIITGIKITANVREGNMLTVSGHFLDGVLGYQYIDIASPGDSLLTVIDKQLGNLGTAGRRLNIRVDYSVGVDFPYNNGFWLANLSEYASAVCRRMLCSLNVMFSHSPTKELVLSARYGSDRTVNQSTLPRVVFSYDFENLIYSDYEFSESGQVTTVYGYTTAPDNVPGPRPTYLHGSEYTGYNRKETAIEVDAVIEEYEQQIVESISAEGVPTYRIIKLQRIDYGATMAKLQTETANEVRETTQNLTGGVDFRRGYKTEYDLGDIVTVSNPKYGVLMHPRITQVREFFNRSGTTVEPVFGTPLPTIADFFNNKRRKL